MTDADRLRDALNKIGAIIRDVNSGASPGTGGQQGTGSGYGKSSPGPGVDMPGCSVKSLPPRLRLKAADIARRINPVNAPPQPPHGAGFAPMDKMQIAVMTAKYWGPSPRQLTVSFLENAPQDLRDRILEHMNAWSQTACITFAQTGGVGDVRISLTGQGYWSYIGTDILQIPKNMPTMNLQEFSMDTPESEYRRVVRHETGHTLGFPHEHMRKDLIARIDHQAAFQYFLATCGWNQQMVIEQVLTPLDEKSLMGTAVDQDSIMCYQLPSSITTDHEPIAGGTDINDTDYKFAGLIYPLSGRSRFSTPTPVSSASPDWPPSQDVDVRL